MVASDIRAADNVSKKSRRRKKRRTAAVSDSSDSSDSSSDEEVQSSDKGAVELSEPKYELSENEDAVDEREILSENTRESLNRIPFTRTEVNSKSTGPNDEITMDMKKVSESIADAKQKIHESKEEKSQSATRLRNSYLELLFENYGDDVNSLRNAPDFTSNSLVTIAQVLKDGACMFDTETLKAMLESN